MGICSDDGRALIWLSEQVSNRPVAELIGHRGALADVRYDPAQRLAADHSWLRRNSAGLAAAGAHHPAQQRWLDTRSRHQSEWSIRRDGGCER
jgi:hypothetical protein